MPIQLTKCVLFHKTYSYWPSIRLVSVSFIKRFQRPSTNNGSIASIGIIMFSSCNRVELILIDDVFIVKLDHTLQTTYRIPWLRLSQTVFTWHLSASTALLLQAKFDSAASILSLSLSLSRNQWLVITLALPLMMRSSCTMRTHAPLQLPLSLCSMQSLLVFFSYLAVNEILSM